MVCSFTTLDAIISSIKFKSLQFHYVHNHITHYRLDRGELGLLSTNSRRIRRIGDTEVLESIAQNCLEKLNHFNISIGIYIFPNNT